MDNVAREGYEVGDIFVAVVEVASNIVGGGEEDERAGGDGLRGVPDVRLEEGVVGATKLLNAEVAVVDEALEKVGISRLGAHLDSAAHAVEGHGDHGVALRPTDGTVLCVVDNRPNAGLGLDEGLVSVSVILWREIVDGGILVEVVGGVGLALGDGAVSDVVVGIRDFVGGDKFVTDVVTVLFVVLRGTAAEKVVGVDVSGIGGVGDGGEKVTMGFVCPRDHGVIGIGEGGFEVCAREVSPAEAIGFGNTACGGIGGVDAIDLGGLEEGVGANLGRTEGRAGVGGEEGVAGVAGEEGHGALAHEADGLACVEGLGHLGQNRLVMARVGGALQHLAAELQKDSFILQGHRATTFSH